MFFYNVEAKGTASITYTIVSKQGYQYKNGAGRAIFDYDDSLDFLELKGSAKAGVGIAGDLCALNMFDLIGYSVEFGVGFNASFTPHVLATDTLFCGDVTLYAYATSGLDKETVVGLFLDKVCHYTLEFEHLKNDENNPLKLKLHLENGRKVDECTFGTGGISGYVYKEGTREALQNARIKIYSGGNLGTNLVRTLYTDANGMFSVDNLHAGEYRVMVSATGYITYDSQVAVKSTENTYLEAFMMVDRNATADAVSVSGTIKDAATGYGLTNSSYAVREGWHNTFGEVIFSGVFENDSFSIQLPSGNYTLEVKKDDYITNSINIAVGSSNVTNANVVLSPQNTGDISSAQGFRVVLTWGETPADLDSHFYGPADQGFFHTYFSDKSHYESGNLIADLDVDDTTSYGPETTTAHLLKEDGIYSFLVHDYTNRNQNSSTKLSMSGAKVQVYVGDACICTFNVPMNTEGTVWHVFDYNALTDEIVAVNEFWYESDPEGVLSLNN